MEEVDNIIFQALHQMGIVISDEVSTLSDFPNELVLVSARKCVDAIMGNDVAYEIPKDTSQKIIVANDIVSHCKKLGYKGDLGYELILYPNEIDLRKLFTFLIDKLPKEADKSFILRDNFSMMMQNISLKITEELMRPWIPPNCIKENVKLYVNGSNSTYCRYQYPFNKHSFKKSAENTSLCEEFLSYWKENVSGDSSIKTSNDIITSTMESEFTSIMEKLTQSKSKLSNVKMTSLLLNKQNLQNGDNESNKRLINPSILSMRELVDTIHQIEEEKDSLIKKITKLHSKRDELSAEIIAARNKESILKEKKETHELVMSLLPEFDTNIEKLMKIKEKETTKLHNLKNEIAALEEEAEKEKEMSNAHRAKHSVHTNEIDALKLKRNHLIGELKKQSALKIQLKRDCEKRNMKKKYIKKRSAYTKRIMEIIGNVAKQKMEINKILSDTRILQKEMNNLNGRLDRSFAVVDELVFKDAKKDEHARKTYKLIAFIHTGCGDIVNNVNDIGSTLREIRDLEKRVEAEKKKNIEENLQRIYSDLKYLQSKQDKQT